VQSVAVRDGSGPGEVGQANKEEGREQMDAFFSVPELLRYYEVIGFNKETI
jgi:hypothetical protein